MKLLNLTKYFSKLKRLSVPSLVAFYLLSCSSEKALPNEPLHVSASYPVGVAVDYRSLTNDTIMNVVVNEFNSMTAENSMKMYTILKDTNYNFSQADAYISYAEKNNIRMFGHALLWHYGLPEHVKRLEGDSAGLRTFTVEYIHKVVSKYKGKITAWDVVNEAVLDKSGEFRDNIWYKTLGEDYIEIAFRAAHEADPEARLFINDYNIERDSAKLDGLLRIVKKLRQQGVPIHGIGIQMHIRMDTPEEIITENVKKVAKTGLLVHFSELDIIFNQHNNQSSGGEEQYTELTTEMKDQQAEKFKRVAEIYNEQVPPDQQFGITFWGISDKHSWIRGFFDIIDWPLIFDDNLQRKPSYYGFKEGLSSNLK